METLAYVLNTKALSGSDVLITLLTPHGLVTVYGKGYASVKSKYHILINRGIKVKIYGQIRGNYFRLSDCDLISTDNLLTLDYDLYEKYTQIVKLVLYIERLLDDVSFMLFDFCVTELENYNINLLIDLWKVFILKKENILLEFESCVVCHKQSDIVTLSIRQGGLICRNCYKQEPLISQADIKSLNAFYKSKISVLKKGYNPTVSQVLSELVEQNVGLKIN